MSRKKLHRCEGQIASAMSTDINLVALKVAHLATLGYNLHALEHKSNFLK